MGKHVDMVTKQNHLLNPKLWSASDADHDACEGEGWIEHLIFACDSLRTVFPFILNLSEEAA